MIDWTRVRELALEIGIEDFDEVVDLFLAEVEDSVSRLASAGDNPVKVEELMHFLKGAALNLGFQGLAQICQQGESDAAANAPPQVTPAQVRAIFEASRTAFLRDLPGQLAA